MNTLNRNTWTETKTKTMNTNQKIEAFLGQFRSQDPAENIYKPKKRRWFEKRSRIIGDPIGAPGMTKTIIPSEAATFNEVFKNTIKYRTQ